MRIIYGINPVKEALRKNSALDKVLISASRQDRNSLEITMMTASKNIPVEKRPEEELTRLANTPGHQGVVALLSGVFAYCGLDDMLDAWKKTGESAFFLILDSIQDPQNLGSLIRTAVCAGVHGIVIPKDRACDVTPVAAKSSAGASEHVLIAKETNLTRVIERLKEENIWSIALEADAKETIYGSDLNRNTALVVGSEGKGIRRLVRDTCDMSLSIPLSEKLNSLNAAQAGAVAMFEVRRQRLLNPP